VALFKRFDSGVNLIGTPVEVAGRVGHAMEEIGSDGSLISTPFQRISRRLINGYAKDWYRRCSAATWCARPTRAQLCAKPCANSE
jgi:hypothetical protein